MPKTSLITFFLIIAVAGYLRFDELGKRPMHADEATAAEILGQQMESGVYRFNPSHFHGPLLLYVSRLFTDSAYESSYTSLSKETLRYTTALAGLLTVAAFGFFWNYLGKRGVIIAASLASVSSIQLYFSRMWIHESLFGLFSMLSLVAGMYYIRKPAALRALAIGISVGLMFATRETVAISVVAWGIAALLTVPIKNISAFIQQHGRHAIIAAITFLLTSFLFYSDFGKNPNGIIDAFSTFFVYETTLGHEKPFGWYFELMLWPTLTGGTRWHELPIFLLALVGAFAAFIPTLSKGRKQKHPGSSLLSGFAGQGNHNLTSSATIENNHRIWAKFFVFATIAHFLIYSFISYKTPWLMLSPWLHVIILAGYGGKIAYEKFSLAWKCAYTLLLVYGISFSYLVAERASFRYHSDARNPYAYSPTSSNLENLEGLLAQLVETSPGLNTQTLGVIGSGYWPLPWYLRSFDKVGYWPKPPETIKEQKIIIAMPDQSEAVAELLADDYFAAPYGLRYEYPITMFIRNDLWSKYNARSD